MAALPPLPPGAKMTTPGNPVLDIFTADADKNLPPLPPGAKLSGGLPPLPVGAKLASAPPAPPARSALPPLPPLPPGAKLTDSPGIIERVKDYASKAGKSYIDTEKRAAATIMAPFVGEENRAALQEQGTLPGKPKNFAQSVNEGPIGTGVGALYAPISAALSPAIEAGVGAAEKKGIVSPETVEKIQAGLNIAGAALPGVKLGKAGKVAKVAEIAPKVEPALVAPEKITAAAVKDGDKIIEGKNHAEAYGKLGRKQDGTLPEGFVTDKGRFISREEAAQLGKETGQAPATTIESGKLHSEDVAKAAGKPEAEGVPLPDRTSDALYKLSNRDETRRLEYVQNLKQIKDVSNATWEKLYAAKDNPALPRTPEEQALYDQHIKPIAERSEQLLQQLKSAGMDFGDVGGAPRRVKGMNAVVEKIYGNKPKEAGYGKRGLSGFSPAAAGRTMWALPGDAGKRGIVYVKDGKLFKNGEFVGEILDKDITPGTGVETSLGKLQQATTAEIEGATKLEYHKNLLANEYLRVQSLERAKDNLDFLEYLKKDPEFLEYAAPRGTRDVPASWRSIPDVRVFEGYRFDPRLAENIEDYLGNIKSPDDFSNAVMNVAKLTKASIFYNPIKHMINATNMFATAKGVVGTARDLPNTPSALLRATKSVITQDKEFREMAKAGLALPSMRDTAQQFNQRLTEAMGLAIRQNPKGMAQLAKDWGYKSTAGMVKALYKGSNKLLWAYSDILAMTRVNEYMARGLSRAEAIKRTERVMANYRIPSRVAGQRWASKALQDPRLTMFGRYDYNRFANLTGMIKRAASKDPGAWEARDQLLALATITTLGYTALDKWIQSETGNDQAHFGMGGFSQLSDVARDVLKGKKSVSQGLMSLFSPGLLAQPFELATGTNMYTGRPIAQRQDFVDMVEAIKTGDFDSAKDYAVRIGFDLTKSMADKFAPVNEMDKYMNDQQSAAQFWLSQMGVNAPSDEQQEGAEKAERYSRRAQRAASRKRPDFVP